MIWTYGLIYGVDNMIQAHAYVCNTLFSIFIVLIGFCLCLKPYRLELLGLFLTIAGVACMFSDPEAERTDGKTGNFWSYSICIGCALFGAFFILVNGILVKVVPIFILLTSQTFLGFWYLAVFIAVTGVHSEYKFASNDKMFGAFGWLNEDEALVAILCFGPTAGFWGNAGYVVALLFFSPVIVSASFLFEPFIGQIVGFLMDIDHLPGWLTWVGTCLVFCGILGIQKADR